MALRIRWYLAKASIAAVTGRPQTAVVANIGLGAYVTETWAPSRAAPVCALVRVIAEQTQLDTFETLPIFAANCVPLRVGATWGTVPRTVFLVAALAAYGLTPTLIADSTTLAEIVNLLGAVREGPGFHRRMHLTPTFAQVTIED